MKTVFLLQVASDARSHKRIRALENLGVKPVVLAFEREFYKGKPLPGGYQSLGRIEHGRYHKRLLPFLQALFRIRAGAKEAEVIYAFGLDMLLLGWLAGRGLGKPITYVYEVADIREILLGNRLLSRCMRWLERFLLRRAELLVVTSEAYVTEFFEKIQSLHHLRYLVIENKPEARDFTGPPDPGGSPAGDGAIRIGFFGVIRCRRSWEILREAANRGNGRVQVYIRGYPMGVGDLEKEAEAIPHIEYGGPYVAPDELPQIYGRVDIVWACYPYQGTGIGNYRWARTNRFYESCYFGRPMFAQKNTEDGRVIESLGLGTCLDLSNIETAVERILSVSETELKQWQQNIARLPREIYMLTDEHKKLLHMLKPCQPVNYPAGTPQIVYIMGRGHSGSTALDLLLGNSTDIESIGELVSGINRDDMVCSCGALYKSCRFWQRVRSTFENSSHLDWDQAARLTTGQAHIKNFFTTLFSSRTSPSIQDLRQVTIDIFAALQEVAQKPIIVDSSKEFTRGLFLARFLPEARIIHLVRDPEGVLASYYYRLKERRGFKFLRRRYRSKHLSVFLMGLISMSWVMGNLLGEIVRAVAPARVIRIRYEDLCNNPKEELKRLESFIGCNLQPVIEAVEAQKPMKTGHNIGGNRIRLEREFVFDPAAGKKRQLPVFFRLMVRTITWPLRMWYGYHGWRGKNG